MKKFKKKLSVLLSGILALGICIPSSTYATDAPELGPNGYVNNTDSGISIRKSVEKIEGSDGQYRIIFDVDGTKPQNVDNPKAEVVLIIDRSGSMGKGYEIDTPNGKKTKMEIVKNAAKDFCQTLLEKNADTKISIVSYAQDATSDIKHSSNLDSIKSTIGTVSYKHDGSWNGTGIKPGGGTNTELGIRKANEVLLEKTVDYEAKKYVVLFTDGLPTRNSYYSNEYYVDKNGNSTDKNTTYPYLKFENNSGNGNPAYYDNDFKGAQRAYHDTVGGTGNIGGIGAAQLYTSKNNNSYKTAPQEILSSVSNTADSSIKFYTMGLFTDSGTTYKVENKEVDNVENIELSNVEEQKEELETTELEKSKISEESIENILENEMQELTEQVDIVEENQNIDEEQLEVSQEQIETNILEELEPQQSEESKVEENLVEVQDDSTIIPYVTLSYRFNSWTSDSLKNVKTDAVMAKEFLYSIQNVESDFNNYVSKYYTSSSTALTNLFNSIADEISAEIVSNIAKNAILNDEVTKYFELVEGSESDNIKGKITYNTETNSISMNIGDITDIKEPGQGPDYTVSFIVQVKDPYYFGKDVPTNVKATLDYDTPVKSNSKHYTDIFNIPHIDINPTLGAINVSKIVENPEIVNNIDKDTFSILLKGISYAGITEDYESEQYNFDLKHGETKSINFIMRSSVLYTKYVELDSYSKNYLDDTKNSNYKELNYVTIGNYNTSEIVPINYELVNIKTNNIDESKFTVDKYNKTNSIVVTNKAKVTDYFYDKDTIVNKLVN